MQEYVIISQNEAKIERYTRHESGEWRYKKSMGLENSIDLPSIGCDLELAKVYKKLDLASKGDS